MFLFIVASWDLLISIAKVNQFLMTIYNTFAPKKTTMTSEQYSVPPFTELKPTDELRSIFKRCHNYIYGNQGLPKDRAFHELLKIIFCKVHDERETQKITFYATDDEKKSPSGQTLIRNRISKIFQDVKKQYPFIFRKDEKIELDDRVLSYIVTELQYYSLLQTESDVKGAAYEELVGSNLRGDRGEFFTPRNVCKMAIEMLYNTFPKKNWSSLKVIDPSCGTGGFLIEVINFLNNFLHKPETNRNKQFGEEIIKSTMPAFCSEYLYGIDINPLLVRTSQMNEILHGDGSDNLFVSNSLLTSQQWSEEMKECIKFEGFDILFTNPPFGSLVPIDDPNILCQYDLGHSWKHEKDKLVKTEKLRASAPPEQLFIERCVQLLKPGGRMAIVLPDSILSNPGLKFIRTWIFEKTRIIASVDLPIETFEPFVGAKTHVILLEKKKREKTEQEKISKKDDYNIFMARAHKVGHDRRGNPLYKRGPTGEEILVTSEKEVIKIQDARKVIEKILRKDRILDDDLPEISTIFKDWWMKNGYE